MMASLTFTDVEADVFRLQAIVAALEPPAPKKQKKKGGCTIL